MTSSEGEVEIPDILTLYTGRDSILFWYIGNLNSSKKTQGDLNYRYWTYFFPQNLTRHKLIVIYRT